MLEEIKHMTGQELADYVATTKLYSSGEMMEPIDFDWYLKNHCNSKINGEI